MFSRRAARHARRGGSGASADGAWLLILVLPALLSPLLFAEGFELQRLARFPIFAMLALSLAFLVGSAGLVSLGHAGFFAAGAYGFAMLAGSCGAPPLFGAAGGLAAATATAALLALASGVFALRTRGIYFLMVTLAIGQVVFYALLDIPFFGGSDGIFLCGAPAQFFGLDGSRSYYVLVSASFALTVLLFWFLRRSYFGRLLRAGEIAESRLEALGYAVFPLHLAAFTVAGAVAGFAGALEAMRFRIVNPELSDWHVSGLLLVMVVLGGRGTLWGPVLGAVLIIGAEEVLVTRYPEDWRVGIGLIAILVALYLPGGLWGSGLWRRVTRSIFGRGGGGDGDGRSMAFAGADSLTVNGDGDGDGRSMAFAGADSLTVNGDGRSVALVGEASVTSHDVGSSERRQLMPAGAARKKLNDNDGDGDGRHVSGHFDGDGGVLVNDGGVDGDGDGDDGVVVNDGIVDSDGGAAVNDVVSDGEGGRLK
ncbi:MAG: branched-chain amino acid ABC transporter permease [Alphaproteobacteria bacterium]|nr:branched-chain amino acid ABC transporter permease [Alphaproteobacteria bacterium]MDA7988632.1 branched-chain amino acid ABC transporter permease [Alphaproteobacteria bacterium]MDA8009246.1 branched-chain amino acid ABC transporter permease [Alphaproteobacteria bacterium]